MMTTTLLALLKLSIMALLLAIGLLSSKKEITYLWRRPKILLRSLLAMYVLVPLVAILFVSFLPLAENLKLAIFVLAISAGAPLLPKKLMGLGADDFVLSLVITASILAIVTVPIWSAALGPLFGKQTHLAPIQVAILISKSFLLPLVVGILARHFFLHDKAESVANKILTIAGGVLTISAVLLLATHWQLLAKAGWPALLALSSLSFISLIIGHLMGGENQGERTALAISCATRHLGLAIMVAAAVPGPRTAVFIAAYIVSSAVVAIPYLKWQRKVNAELSSLK